MPEDVFGIVGTLQAGTFKVREVVAEGGFAVVYRARHQAFRSNVALKCLKIPAMLDSEEQKGFLRSFQEEAELLFRLSSAIPAVVRPLQAGKLQGPNAGFAPFLALEWLKGKTLSEFLAERRAKGEAPPRMSQTLKLLGPVFEALDRAHQFPVSGGMLCVVHRDLKPDNIFVADVGGTRSVKILDYGIAKAKSAASQLVGQQSMRASDFTAFTPAYAAPEQWNPKKYGQTGSWTDVWGLGMVLVECLVGSPIDRGAPAEFMARALDPHDRPTPKNLGADVSDAVERVFARALAVDPKHRISGVAELYRELAAAVGKSAEKLPKVTFLNPDLVRRDQMALSGGVEELRPRAEVLGSAEISAMNQLDGLVFPVPSLRVPMPRVAAEADDDDDDDDDDAPPPPPAVPPPYDVASMNQVGRTIDGMTMFQKTGKKIELDAPARIPPPRRAPRSFLVEESAETGFSATSKQLGLQKPIGLAALGCGLMFLDWAYVQAVGESFSVGPVRTIWVAGPIAILGLGQIIARVAKAEG